MKCAEIFYDEETAIAFAKTLIHGETEIEIDKTKEPNDDIPMEEWVDCWVVWFYPRPYTR